jgi:hypothetical protein
LSRAVREDEEVCYGGKETLEDVWKNGEGRDDGVGERSAGFLFEESEWEGGAK